MRHRQHPWRDLRVFADWTVEWVSHLPPGRWGRTLHAEKKIQLVDGMTQAERRCTLDHELDHVRHGPVSVGPTWEARIDRASARRLIPLENLIEGLIRVGNPYELAEELWVDVPTLLVRLADLTDEEVARVNDAMADVQTHYPRAETDRDDLEEPAC